jgi:hypothetical protein
MASNHSHQRYLRIIRRVANLSAKCRQQVCFPRFSDVNEAAVSKSMSGALPVLLKWPHLFSITRSGPYEGHVYSANYLLGELNRQVAQANRVIPMFIDHFSLSLPPEKSGWPSEASTTH